MSRVSIVVPTYNQARYLPICLDSIWFQDHPEIEIVVVNDGSADDTEAVLDAYCRAVAEEETSFASDLDEAGGRVLRTVHKRYPAEGRSLIRLRHERNQGLSTTLNLGFQACTGDYCTFIASDDMLLPSMVSELSRALEETPADFAYADMHVVDDTGRVLRRFALPDYSFEAAFCHWYLCGICKLYRRELHERHGYFDLGYYGQDHEMYLRFAMGGARFVHVPKVLANVRIHDRDREVHNHTPENMRRLFDESSRLVRLAREFARSGRGG